MKKIISFLGIFACLLVSSFLPSVKAASPADQSCVANDAFTSMIRTESNKLSQSFKPTITHLSRVTIKIKGDGIGKLGMGIVKDNLVLAWNNEGAISEPNGTDKTVTFTFNDLDLKPDQEYYLLPRISTDNAVLFWYYKNNCYSRGAAYMGKIAQNYDFDFAVYGWTDDQPPVSALNLDEDEDVDQPKTTQTASAVITPTPNTSQASTPAGVLVDQSSLTTNITDSILPPTNLKAFDTPNDNGGSITLTWNQSETKEIKNYTVFRQYDPMGDIYKLGETKELTFVDKEALAGQKFYYFVRTNKDEMQSNDSLKVSAISVANLTAPVLENKEESNIAFYLIGFGLILLIGIVITIYYFYKKKKNTQL